MRPPAPVRSFAPGLSHEAAVGGVLQLQDMANVNQNCILASALCFAPPPAGLAEGKNGRKWKRNFLHAANVAALRLESRSGQQEQGGEEAKLTFHISRHLHPRAGSESGVRDQASRPGPARLPRSYSPFGGERSGAGYRPANPRRHRPSRGRGEGGLPARQGIS